jgi:hypothetical protein
MMPIDWGMVLAVWLGANIVAMLGFMAFGRAR